MKMDDGESLNLAENSTEYHHLTCSPDGSDPLNLTNHFRGKIAAFVWIPE